MKPTAKKTDRTEKPVFRVTDYGVVPDLPAIQTKALQAVLDLCRPAGGTVILPRGTYHTGGLWLWSGTTLVLEPGVLLKGSANREDYPVFPVPSTVRMRCDMQLITDYYPNGPWETYRRAILSAYGERDISILGSADSIIDGSNCYDPDGEEGYRGPHAIFLSDCRNVRLEGYTVQHSGNFLHEANSCEDLIMDRVTCIGGSDGIHLHCTKHATIRDCVFRTGDDCVAGINVEDLVVKHCFLNTSCNLFRLGGRKIRIEDCIAIGPGEWPHRMTVVKGPGKELPKEQGRHNTLFALTYFASTAYPYEPSDITFRNCLFENFYAFLEYRADNPPLQAGTHLGRLNLENVRIRNMETPFYIEGNADEPLKIRLRSVTVWDGDELSEKPLFVPGPNVEIRELP